MAINKLISYCRVGEAGEVGAQIVATFSEYTIEDNPVVTDIVSNIKDRSSALNLAWKRSVYESNLETKDGIRDDKLRAFYYTVIGASYSTSAEKRDAAGRLLTIFNKYGLDIVNENYDDESADLKSLISDISTPEAVADIAKIEELPNIAAELKTAQGHFTQAVTDWKMESASEKEKRSASAIKKEIVELINAEFIPFLKVLMRRKPDTFKEFGMSVAKIIADKNMIIKRRKDSREK